MYYLLTRNLFDEMSIFIYHGFRSFTKAELKARLFQFSLNNLLRMMAGKRSDDSEEAMKELQKSIIEEVFKFAGGVHLCIILRRFKEGSIPAGTAVPRTPAGAAPGPASRLAFGSALGSSYICQCRCLYKLKLHM